MTVGRKLVLLAARLVMAFIFFNHGWPKVTNPGQTMDFFAGLGLPGILGPIVGWTELLCSGLLALGVLHYVAVVPLLIVIVGALLLVQIPGGIDGTFERDFAILVTMGLLLGFGPGGWSLDEALGDTGP